ncbi:HEPN domain-containing protein [Candidatus Bathyarchaeota archaeon]|nr:HEPN domain-containing protein [Candidatus Bathyarchaeota archaeon]MBS7629191.1 HEPN domain-containing protein [Candidatus Bathyarchaeota archaeon]
MTREEEEKNLLRRSRDFMETAEYQTSRGLYDLAAFSLEQALQLFLKAKLLAEGVDYPRTHSVRSLLEMLSDLISEDRRIIVKRILEDYILELGMLEDAYITSRYVMREFVRQEVEKLAGAVREIMRIVS